MGAAVDGFAGGWPRRCGGGSVRRWIGAAVGVAVGAAVDRCGDAVEVDQYATPPGVAFFLLTVICTSPLVGSVLLARNGSYGSCGAFGGGSIVRGWLCRAE
jgi:hypothetical protein